MSETNKIRKTADKPAKNVLTLQSVPMPSDTISDSYISAGWILSQMDVAGGIRSARFTQQRVVTVGINAMSFHEPVYSGDTVNFNTDVMHMGQSSVTMKVESFAQRVKETEAKKVTEGLFTYVAIDDDHKPTPILKPSETIIAPQPAKKVAGPTDFKFKDEPFDSNDYDNLALRIVAQPKHANYQGDIFGGWILANMDFACTKVGEYMTGETVATAGVDAMKFVSPIYVGNVVSFYTKLSRTGTTSMTIDVAACVKRDDWDREEKVAEGAFSYVTIDNDRNPIPLKIRGPVGKG